MSGGVTIQKLQTAFSAAKDQVPQMAKEPGHRDRSPGRHNTRALVSRIPFTLLSLPVARSPSVNVLCAIGFAVL